jgi:hypothetical protein
METATSRRGDVDEKMNLNEVDSKKNTQGSGPLKLRLGQSRDVRHLPAPRWLGCAAGVDGNTHLTNWVVFWYKELNSICLL